MPSGPGGIRARTTQRLRSRGRHLAVRVDVVPGPAAATALLVWGRYARCGRSAAPDARAVVDALVAVGVAGPAPDTWGRTRPRWGPTRSRWGPTRPGTCAGRRRWPEHWSSWAARSRASP